MYSYYSELLNLSVQQSESFPLSEGDSQREGSMLDQSLVGINALV